MKVAYIVSAYKLPQQLVRLVRRLDAPGVSFAIHVDRRSPDAVQAEAAVCLRELPSVEFLPRHRCHWGGFGHVRATLKGIDHLLAAGVDFDYLVLLTGQDYPLRPPAAIADFLERAGGRSFISNWPLPHAPWGPRGGLERIEDLHWIRGRRLHLSLALRRRLPGGLRPYGGSPYWCLARPAVEHVHEFVHENPAYVRFFEHVFVPDELFFQTILLGSGLAAGIVDDNLREIEWSRQPAPAILGAGDLDRLLASPKLFARKFDVTVDAGILDLLDRHLDRAAA